MNKIIMNGSNNNYFHLVLCTKRQCNDWENMMHLKLQMISQLLRDDSVWSPELHSLNKNKLQKFWEVY